MTEDSLPETDVTVKLYIGEHGANLVAESIEVTLKAVSKDILDSDDADAVFTLQRAYMEYREKHFKKKDDIFRHGYHWTVEQLKEYGILPETKSE